MKCLWCDNEVDETVMTCYWVTPDGRKTVEIQEIPAVDCENCQEPYVPEELAQKIDEYLYLNDIDQLGDQFSYEQLKNAPEQKNSIFSYFK